jgi:hypothetical protein
MPCTRQPVCLFRLTNPPKAGLLRSAFFSTREFWAFSVERYFQSTEKTSKKKGT